MGMPDTTRNLFRSLITQLSVLYDREPIVDHARPDAVERMAAIVNGAGLWQLAITQQQQTLALREGLYRFDVTRGDQPRLLARIVPADLVWAWTPPDNPDVPELIYEYRQRPRPDSPDFIWTRDVADIRDLENPVFRIESANGKADITDQYLDAGDLSGDAYPYRAGDGRPILPYVLYHAMRTGRLWDPYRGIELVEGSLAVAGLLTQWRHLVRDASWPQRWALNAVVDGAIPDPATGDLNVSTDPSSLVNFKALIPGQSTGVGQFKPGGNPKELLEAIGSYASDLAADFAFYADVKRTHVSARSGYAIELSREAQRAAQRRFEPQFSRGDVQSLEVIAALWNRATGDTLPEDGWTIRYPGLPLSMEERRLLMEEHQMRADMGITSKPKLLAAVDGLTEDQARDELVRIEIDQARFDQGGGGAVGNEAANRPAENTDHEDEEEAELELTDEPTDEAPETPASNAALAGVQIIQGHTIIDRLIAGTITKEMAFAQLINWLGMSADAAAAVLSGVDTLTAPEAAVTVPEGNRPAENTDHEDEEEPTP